MIAIEARRPDPDALLALYTAVGWTAYTREPDVLVRAIEASPWVRTAWSGATLVGLCRAVGDGETICYLQDVLVDPAFQRQGIGRRLVQACLDDHAHVRQLVLLTDDRPEQLAFYASLGLSDVAALERVRLHAFVRVRGVVLD